MALKSSYKSLGSVKLPKYKGRQKYMETVNALDPLLPGDLEAYNRVVKHLLKQAGHTGEAHVTIDEKIVPAGMSQRRPGAHVDGCYIPSGGYWGHSSGGSGWLHYCNSLPMPRMAVIIAASVAGCIVYPGEFDTEPKNDGDLEHIRELLGEGQLLDPNVGYLLSPDCVHESVVFRADTKRSFLRIAYAL